MIRTSKDRIKELEVKINQARHDYYNGQSQISDQVFDAWTDELRSLEPSSKAITAVGAPVVSSEWKKAKHRMPLGSLDKVNTPEELSKWVNEALPDGKLCITEKLDGISIEVIYENGSFVQAITRGDGEIGEDISVNVSRMRGVLSQLKDNFTGSLRGEIIMLKSIHQQFFSDKANPRNAASGVSKRLDGVGVDKLNILFYQALGDIEFGAEQAQFVWLVNQGLSTPNWWVVKTADQVNDFWRDYQDNKRAQLDYEIDGLVVRIDNLEKQAAMGEKDLRPRGAKAFKFDNEARESVIREVIWQTGSSGRITPVAVIDPVMLVGAEVRRASLYNMTYIRELGLDIGATVLVVRANDVIPKIEELIKSTGSIIKPPSHCAECNSPVIEVGEYIQCPNVAGCPALIKGRVSNWISEINILEWGETLIDKLVETGKVKTIADLYTLTVEQLAEIDRMGKKSATKCHSLLWAAKEVPLEILLGGLSIPMIGQSTIKAIMKAGYETLEQFKQLDAAGFEKVAGVGPTKAKSLAEGLKHNQQLIEQLLANGVKIKEIKMGKLTGKSFCFTGALSIKRAEAEQMVLDEGGEVKSGITRNLGFLVIADIASTSSKAEKARSLGTKLISEDEFMAMLA